MSDFFDLIILGGGCAGLSLATRLAASGVNCPHIAVVERRDVYTHDRTWCFFKDSQTPSLHSAQHEWSSMRVSTTAGSTAVDCVASPYQMVHAGQFYQDAQKMIEQNSQVKLLMGASISHAPEKQGDQWRVETTAGTLHARFIVDTRPAASPERGGASLWQSFYGQEIECEIDVFDPTCGDLMDFAAAEHCGALMSFPDSVAFVYVLPTSSKRALVEFTVFGPDPMDKEAFFELQAKAVAQRLAGAAYSVLRTEHGVLPMGAKPVTPSGDPTYIFAGVTAGGARPSSGYAFARIQRWAAACSVAIISGTAPVGHAPDGLILRAMDALFLKVVRACSRVAPDLFLALFAGADSRHVIRFLNDRGTLADYAAVVGALLPGPLLRALAGPRRVRPQQAIVVSGAVTPN